MGFTGGKHETTYCIFSAEHLRMHEKSSKEIFNLSLLTYDRIYSRIFNYKKLLEHRVFENDEDIFKTDDNNRSLLDGNTLSFIVYYLLKLPTPFGVLHLEKSIL